MRALIALSVAVVSGILAAVAGAAITGSWRAALFGGLVVAGLVAAWSYRRPILPIDEAACPRALKIISLLATLLALVQLGRIAVFMVDSSRVNCSVLPSSDWEIRHSCASAYFVAGRAVGQVPNVYDDSLYSFPNDDPTARRRPRMIEPFRVDVYEYPPPFLLLPRAIGLVTSDFMRFRMIWFALNAAALLLAMLALAGSLAPAARTRALLLLPLAWAALPMLSVLQKGNAQVIVFAVSMLAMVLFERRRHALGGALLSFALVSKLYPGLLLVYLVIRRDWAALGWTMAFSAAFVLASVLDTGWGPMAAFLDHLPGLLGGEAFPAFRVPAAIAINHSVPGLVFKLKLFGVPGMSFATSKIVGWIYTVIAVAATMGAARRPLGNDAKPMVWMAILILATLRSPFLPQAYAQFPPIWLLTLLAATATPTTKTLILTVLAWVVLNVFVPMDSMADPRRAAVIILLPQALGVGLSVVALRCAARFQREGR